MWILPFAHATYLNLLLSVKTVVNFLRTQNTKGRAAVPPAFVVMYQRQPVKNWSM
jgi:hypothetical protein